MKKTKTKFCYSNYYELKNNKKQKAYLKKLPEGTNGHRLKIIVDINIIFASFKITTFLNTLIKIFLNK